MFDWSCFKMTTIHCGLDPTHTSHYIVKINLFFRTEAVHRAIYNK